MSEWEELCIVVDSGAGETVIGRKVLSGHQFEESTVS